MYGTGFRGALEGDAAFVAGTLAGWSGPTVSVDIPSGVDGLSGLVFGPTVQATRTVTFAARKPGLVFEPGRSHAGQVVVVDIGIPVDGDAHAGLVTADDVRAWLPGRPPDAHKWQAAVMVVGGSGGMTGAPLFVSHAAMRAGAGIVWCGLPGADAARAASGSEVIARVLPANAAGVLARADAAETVLATIGRFGALALGPGLGGSRRRRPAVRGAHPGRGGAVAVGARRRRPQRARRRLHLARSAADTRHARGADTPRRRVPAAPGPTGRRRPVGGRAVAWRIAPARSCC